MLTIRNSVSNVIEIIDLLDKDAYNEAELQENYKYLIDKWGEWEIIGANQAGLVVRYVDIGKAFFNSLMKVFLVLTVFCFCAALFLGKFLFPTLSKYYATNNDELVDMATLKSAAQIDEISKKKDKKEWF